MSGGSQSGEGRYVGVLVTHRVGKTAGRYLKMIKCYFDFVFGGVHRGWEGRKKEFGEQTTSSTLLTHELRGPEGDDCADPERVLEGPWLLA